MDFNMRQYCASHGEPCAPEETSEVVPLAANSAPVLRIIYWKELYELVGLSKSSVRRLEEEGKFPQRIQIMQRKVGWNSIDVHRWIRGRFANAA